MSLPSARTRQPSGRTNLAQAGSNALEFSPITKAPPAVVVVAPTERTQSSLFTSATGAGKGRTHRSRSELLKTRRAIHTESVSLTESPKMLRQMAQEMDRNDFDMTQNVLTERSVELAKQVVARQFFSTIDKRGQLTAMGKGLDQRPLEDNVDLMMSSDFTRSLRALKYRQRVIEGKGSRQMHSCLNYSQPAEVGDPTYLAQQNAQYKPYTQSYDVKSDVRTFNELRMRRIRENIESGEVFQRNRQRGIPENVNFRRVSAFKLDNGDIDR